MSNSTEIDDLLKNVPDNLEEELLALGMEYSLVGNGGSSFLVPDLIFFKNIYSIDWNLLLSPQPYLEYQPNGRGEKFPLIHSVINYQAYIRDSNNNHEDELKMKYKKLLLKYKLTEKELTIDKLSHVHNLQSELLNGINTLIEELESVDLRIIGVLKVFYTEKRKSLVVKADSESIIFDSELINFEKSSSIKILEHQIHEIFKYSRNAFDFVNIDSNMLYQLNNIIKEAHCVNHSLINGLQSLIDKKRPLIQKLSPLYDDLISISIVLFKHFKNISLYDDVIDQIEKIGIYSKEDFSKNKYWETAKLIYDKGLPWSKTYDFIKSEMRRLDLDLRHNNFDSFNTARKKRVFKKKG